MPFWKYLTMLAVVNTIKSSTSSTTGTRTNSTTAATATAINGDVSCEDHEPDTTFSNNTYLNSCENENSNIDNSIERNVSLDSSEYPSSEFYENNNSLGYVNNFGNQICRFYLRGYCHYGDTCRFSHDLSYESNASDAFIDEPSTSSKCNYHTNNWADAPAFVPGCMKLSTCPGSSKTATATGSMPGPGPIKDNSTFGFGEVISSNGVINDCSAGTSNSNIDSNDMRTIFPQTWASIVGGPNYGANSRNNRQISADSVCPFEAPCPHRYNCPYPIHLEFCKMCDQFCLHPTDQEQRRVHIKECLEQHEQAMELAFAIARSKDKTCGICFDVIMEKTGREKRFGILPNCNHIFCLECIRKWRQAKQFEHKITRSCPECRIASDFVCPSAFWVETKEEKDKLLTDYRAALGIKDCKYFKKGEGLCPFGNKCFYKHALPDGKLVDVGLPKRTRKVRRSSTDISNLLDVTLWEVVAHRDFFYASDFEDSDYVANGYI